MREPRFVHSETGEEIPYSSAPSQLLQAMVNGLVPAWPEVKNNKFYSREFRIWWAKEILKWRS